MKMIKVGGYQVRDDQVRAIVRNAGQWPSGSGFADNIYWDVSNGELWMRGLSNGSWVLYDTAVHGDTILYVKQVRGGERITRKALLGALEAAAIAYGHRNDWLSA